MKKLKQTHRKDDTKRKIARSYTFSNKKPKFPAHHTFSGQSKKH